MNDLSWIIYLSSVLPGLSMVLWVFSIGYLIKIVLEWVENKDKRWWLPFFTMILACLIPSQETLLAIAASERGEEVLVTPVMNFTERGRMDPDNARRGG